MMQSRGLVRTLVAGACALAGFIGVAGALAQPPAAEQPKAPAETEKTVQVIMTTSMGDVTIELNREKAPVSVDNFLKYVDEKFYDGTVFHRVIPTFMIQGGGFTADMNQKKTHAPIKNEWKNGLKNTRGTVAMARTSVPDSATSQFFINTVDNGFLSDPQPGADPSGFVGYAVFGKVVAGMDVVDKIKAVKTGRKNGMSDVPVDTVEIKSIKRADAKPAAPAKPEAKPEAKPAEPAKKGG